MRLFTVALAVIFIASSVCSQTLYPIVAKVQGGTVDSALRSTKGSDLGTSGLNYRNIPIPTVQDLLEGTGMDLVINGRTVTFNSTFASDLRIVAGHPLYIDTSTPPYVDIGVKGGTHPLSEKLFFDAHNPPADPFDPLWVPIVWTEAPVQINLPLSYLWDGTEWVPDSGYPNGLQFMDPESGLPLVNIGSNGISDGTPLVSWFYGSGASYCTSTFSVRSGSGDPTVPVISGAIRGEYGLFKEDAHGYDAVYAGDPAGTVWGGVHLGHIHSYGNIEANPTNAIRENGSGLWVKSSTGSTDNKLRIYTDTNGVYYDATPAMTEVLTPTIRKHQFQNLLTAAGTGTGLAVTNNATVGGTLTATGAVTVNNTGDFSDTLTLSKATGNGLVVADDGTLGGAFNVGPGASGTAGGTISVRGSSGGTTNEMRFSTSTTAGTIELTNASASAATLQMRGPSGAQFVGEVQAVGTDINAFFNVKSTGTGQSRIQVFLPTTTGSSTGSDAIYFLGASSTELRINANNASDRTTSFFNQGAGVMNVWSDGRMNVGTASPATSGAFMQSLSYSGAYASKSANYTPTASDFFIKCTAAVTLDPDISVTNTGQYYRLKNTSAGNVTIDPAGGTTIDGAATFLLAAGLAIDIIDNGSNYETW